MIQENFDKWSEMAKKAQEPFKEIAELNVKTLQGLAFLKPEDLAHIKNPQEILEKQISVVIENGHKALDYLQQSFEIMEKTMLSLAQEAKKAANEQK